MGRKTLFIFTQVFNLSVMEEQEVPTEGLSEQINEQAEKEKAAKEKSWSFYIAISTALIAVLAAISSLMAGHHSNEALIEQIKASDQWAFYQAKGIKADVVSLNRDNYFKDSLEKKYKAQQQDIKKEAEKDQNASEMHLQKHILLAKSVTLFQISIAISAISILSKKRILWYFAILIAITGIGFFTSGLI
jgi:Flp pilus assembly protein TadB